MAKNPVEKTGRAKRTLKIPRSLWRRGTGKESMLASDEGAMCVLGHYFTQVVGIPEEDLINMGTLGYVLKTHNLIKQRDLRNCLADVGACWVIRPSRRKKGAVVDSEEASEIMNTNDAVRSTDAKREESLKKQFAKFDVNLEFEG